MADVRILNEQMLEEVRQQGLVDYVLSFDSLPSTNDRAKGDCAERAPFGLGLYVAVEQTAGRGRGENVWEAGPGSLLFSLVWSLDSFPLSEAAWPLFSLGYGLGVCQALEGLDPCGSLSVKWPNDVYLEGKKIGGLLLEPSADKRALVLGVGCNVHNDLDLLPFDVRSRATRLQEFLFDPSENRMGDVLLAMVGSLDGVMLGALGGSLDLCEAWAERCFLKGKRLVVGEGDQRVEGCCLGLAVDGGLLVETSEGVRRCYAGSVEVLL